MKSTKQVAYDFMKKYVDKVVHECPGDIYAQEAVYTLSLQKRMRIDLEEKCAFSNQAELDEFIDERVYMQFNQIFFDDKNGTILYPEDIIEFRQKVDAVARKTGNIFEVLEVVDDFCRSVGRYV